MLISLSVGCVVAALLAPMVYRLLVTPGASPRPAFARRARKPLADGQGG